MIALLAVIVSMQGCASVVVPAAPVPAPVGLSRCDPGRLGWAAEGSLWLTAPQPLSEVRL